MTEQMFSTAAGTDTGGRSGDAVTRRVGGYSAWITVVLALLYLPTLALGFASIGGTGRPLPDPYLAVAEVLIILMAPPLVVMSGTLLLIAAPGRRVWGLAAFGFTLLLVGTTVPVHIVELLVARRLQPGPPAGTMFGWDWPGVLYAVDITAWDLFFGLALVFATAALTGPGLRAARLLLVAAGVLSLAGLVGPVVDAIGLRMIGIVGCAVVFPIGAGALGRSLLRSAQATGTFDPVPRVS